jgi:hypothetical protein
MRQVFRTDMIDFEVCSLTLPEEDQRCGGDEEVTRSFSRLSDAAAENGESRILVGFHFRHAVEDGMAHGRQIGSWVVSHYMKPANG